MKLIIGIFVVAVVLFFAYGCNSIRGGQTRHETGAFTIDYDGVHITDTREVVATTQPSASGTGAMPKLGAQTKEGLLGGASFDEMKNTVRANWAMFLIFVGCAVFSYFIGKWVLLIASVALAVLSIVYPGAIVFLAIGTLAVTAVVVVLHYRTQIAQLGKGNELALNNLPPSMAAEAKLLMESKQDEATKMAVMNVVTPLREAAKSVTPPLDAAKVKAK